MRLLLVPITWTVLAQMSRRFFAMGVPWRSQLPVWLLFFTSSFIIFYSTLLNLGSILKWGKPNGMFQPCDPVTNVLFQEIAIDMVPRFIPTFLFLRVMTRPGEEEMERDSSVTVQSAGSYGSIGMDQESLILDEDDEDTIYSSAGARTCP
jgi:hypothetical protein